MFIYLSLMVYRDYYQNTAKKAEQVTAVQNNISYRSDKTKLILVTCIRDIIDWPLTFVA